MEIPETLVLGDLTRKMEGHGTGDYLEDIPSSSKWLVGSLPELADAGNQDYLKPKAGQWIIGSHYDHLWAMWAYYAELDPNVELTYYRTTEDSSVYGFIPEEGALQVQEDIAEEKEEIKEIREKIKEDEEEISNDRIEEFLIHRAQQSGGNVEFGRGDDAYHLYLIKKGNRVFAWALLTDSIIEHFLNAEEGREGFSRDHSTSKGEDEQKKIIVLTCMDHRVNPHDFGDFEDDRLHILKNAGGRATEDMIRSIIASVRLFGSDTVFVVHHTDCGLQKVDDSKMQGLLKKSLGPAHLDQPTKLEKDNHDRHGHSSQISFLPITDLEQSVLDDIDFIRSHPLISKKLNFCGYIYDVKTKQMKKIKKACTSGSACQLKSK